MSIVTGFSRSASVEQAVLELKTQLGPGPHKVVIFFASSQYPQEELGRQVESAFPGAEVLGCSTAGEIVSGFMLQGTVVAMGLPASVISDLKVEVLEGIGGGNPVREAFASLGEHFGTPMSELAFERYVGLVLFDGLSGAEESIMDTMGDLTNVTIVGGSAGDDLGFKATSLFARGRSWSNAAVVAILEPAVPFRVLKTQSFCVRDRVLVPTRVNEETREVLEFDGRPAAVAYAQALGTDVATAPSLFMTHPVGLMVGDEPYVRSPRQIVGDGVAFYCKVIEGQELSLLESTDIVADTRRDLDAALAEMGHVSGIINFHCILRTLELQKKGQTEEYGKIFSEIPTIGFSTYGEAYLGHINQTSTMLLFG